MVVQRAWGFLRSRTLADFGGVSVGALAMTMIITEHGGLALAVLPIVLKEALVSLSFFFRSRPIISARGVGPWIAAFGHAFILPAYVLIGPRLAPSWIEAPAHAPLAQQGKMLWLAGFFFLVYAVFALRHSFSIVAAARHLVTSGPYGVARHPIYAAHLLMMIGIWMVHATPAFGVLLVAWLGLMIWRVRYEEQVLTAAFPEYVQYRSRVGMLGPIRLPVGALRTRRLAPSSS